MRIVHLLATAVFCLSPIISVMGWNFLWLAFASLMVWSIYDGIKSGMYRLMVLKAWEMNASAIDMMARRLS